MKRYVYIYVYRYVCICIYLYVYILFRDGIGTDSSSRVGWKAVVGEIVYV